MALDRKQTLEAAATSHQPVVFTYQVWYPKFVVEYDWSCVCWRRKHLNLLRPGFMTVSSSLNFRPRRRRGVPAGVGRAFASYVSLPYNDLTTAGAVLVKARHGLSPP